MNILRTSVAVLALTAAIAAEAETVTVTRPGTLSAAVTDTDATDLTIIGSVDAADLFWAAKNMESLKTLNLANVTIEAYNGELLNGRVAYPAGAIPEMSLAGTNLTSVVLPATGNITISEGAFANTPLTAISIHDGITAIGDGAFAACNSLTAVTIPATTKVGTHVFASCTALTTVTLGATTATIGDGLFKDCTSLKTVNGTDGLTTIGDDAFSGCTSLTDFVFGNTLHEIGAHAFAGSALANANLANANDLKKVGDWAFAHCDALATARFSDQADVTVGKGVFFDCFELAEITLPAKLHSLSAYTLKGTIKASGYDLPVQIDSIGAYALKDNEALQTLTLPSTLTFIGDGAMENVTGLSTIDATALDIVPLLGDDVWAGIDQSNVVLKVNEGIGENFKATPQWQDFKIDIQTAVNDIISDNTAEGTKATIRGRFVGTDLILQASGSPFSNIRVYNISGCLVAALDTDLSEVVLDTSDAGTDIFIVAAVLADNTTGTLKIIRR